MNSYVNELIEMDSESGAFVRGLKLMLLSIVVLQLHYSAMVGAAGLGRLSVRSSLGQPLLAELDLVGVTPEESASLAVRFSSGDVKSRNAKSGVDLAGLKMSIEKREKGQFYIKILGNRPFNDAFLDLPIELSWTGGRIVRDYTALIDPPGYVQQALTVAPPVVVLPQAIKPAPTANAEPVVQSEAVDETAARAPAELQSNPVADVTRTPDVALSKSKAKETISSTDATQTVRVKSGDTLINIANTHKVQGATLEQMLIALYRNNLEAFPTGNMNAMKAGQILRLPDAKQVTNLPHEEAAKVYQAQVNDWRAYLKNLSNTALEVTTSGSAVRGKIATKVDDADVADKRDVVRLSKTDDTKGGKKKGRSQQADQEDAQAVANELAEAKSRIAELEKTLEDTKKLMALNNENFALAQQQAKERMIALERSTGEQVIAWAMANQAIAGAIVSSLLMSIVGLAILFRKRLQRQRAQSQDGDLGGDLEFSGDSQGNSREFGARFNKDRLTGAASNQGRNEALTEAEIWLASLQSAGVLATDATAAGQAVMVAALDLLESVDVITDDEELYRSVCQNLRVATISQKGSQREAARLALSLLESLKVFAPDDQLYLDIGQNLRRVMNGEAIPAVMGKSATKETVAEKLQKVEFDFNFEGADQPAKTIAENVARVSPQSAAQPVQSASAKPEQTFKIDLDDLRLDLGGDKQLPEDKDGNEKKDANWYDVQQKFDLAKAYHEMGDNEGAIGVLQEVLRDGDKTQKNQADKLLSTLT